MFGFGKKPVRKPAGRDLRQFCYSVAYSVLPQLLFADHQRTIGYFTAAGPPPGAYLYAIACSALKTKPRPEDTLLFQTHSGQLTEGYDYHILQYPDPPPLDMGDADMASMASVVLAPYFSAILQEQGTGEVSYYILGQRPFGGTTLRSLSAGGINANLGEGPVPELNLFREVLRQRVQQS